MRAAGAAIVDDRGAAVEAAIGGCPEESVRVIPRPELAEMTGLDLDDLDPDPFEGLRVVTDLARRVVDLGAAPPVAYLYQGWMWVDGSFLDALETAGTRSDVARALIQHVAVSAAHPEWSVDEIAERAAPPPPDALDELRPSPPLPEPSHPFEMLRDSRGRWALMCPGDRCEPMPDAIAGAVRVVLDIGPFHVIGAGCVVDVDDDAIWIVTSAHHLPRAGSIEVIVDESSNRATVVPPDPGRLVEALAAERGLAPDAPEVALAALGLDIALLRVGRTVSEPSPPPVPLAVDLVQGAHVLTVGYTSHPVGTAVLADLFGTVLADVPIISAGVLELGTSGVVEPNVDLSPAARAREAGGGRAVIVMDDPWPTDPGGGGPVLVCGGPTTSDRQCGYVLAGIAIAHHHDERIGPVTVVVDSSAVRALLHATREADPAGTDSVHELDDPLLPVPDANGDRRPPPAPSAGATDLPDDAEPVRRSSGPDHVAADRYQFGPEDEPAREMVTQPRLARRRSAALVGVLEATLLLAMCVVVSLVADVGVAWWGWLVLGALVIAAATVRRSYLSGRPRN